MQYIESLRIPGLHTVEWLGEPPEAKLEVFEETETRRIITHNDSPDVGFDYTVNCYRGCIHGCTYCFSRPTHEYLGYGAGTDFDRKIVVKTKAPELFRKELMKPSWKAKRLSFRLHRIPHPARGLTTNLQDSAWRSALSFDSLSESLPSRL